MPEVKLNAASFIKLIQIPQCFNFKDDFNTVQEEPRLINKFPETRQSLTMQLTDYELPLRWSAFPIQGFTACD